MTQHTPGPWEYQRSLEMVDGAYDFAIMGTGAPVLAETFGRSAKGEFLPAEANARLIAAAPELLAAAMLGLEALRSSAGHDERAVAERELRAAIDKIEGRS